MKYFAKEFLILKKVNFSKNDLGKLEIEISFLQNSIWKYIDRKENLYHLEFFDLIKYFGI